MKYVEIVDLAPEAVPGVEVMMPDEGEKYCEAYFEWVASALSPQFGSRQVSGGILKAWHHAPIFSEIETHIDREMFYFISGTALMLFMDAEGGVPKPETAQIMRIRAGTQLVIEAGKGHFVPVAEGDEPMTIVVAAPKMDAPRTALKEPICASLEK